MLTFPVFFYHVNFSYQFFSLVVLTHPINLPTLVGLIAFVGMPKFTNLT
jgi:hypothetical protein